MTLKTMIVTAEIHGKRAKDRYFMDGHSNGPTASKITTPFFESLRIMSFPQYIIFLFLQGAR